MIGIVNKYIEKDLYQRKIDIDEGVLNNVGRLFLCRQILSSKILNSFSYKFSPLCIVGAKV